MSDNVLACVAFLYGDIEPDQTRPAATAFLVGKQIEPNRVRLYAITAGHVITNLQRISNPMIRFNSRSGGSVMFPLDLSRWTHSAHTDLAASEVAGRVLEEAGFVFSWVDPGALVNAEILADWSIGTGDDVFMVGMLNKHPGAERNEPTVRRGGIALIPADPVRVETSPGTFRDIEGYLIELWSMSGHSGSPVFIYPPIGRIPGMHEGGGATPALLGVVQGHFDAAVAVGAAPELGGRDRNTGIAVVIPAHQIAELLMDPALEEEHKRREDGV